MLLSAPIVVNAAGDDDLVGTWEYGGGITKFVFKDNGIFKYTQSGVTLQGNYTVNNNHVTMIRHGSVLFAGNYTIEEGTITTITFNWDDGGSITMDRVGENGRTDESTPGFGFVLLGMAATTIVLLRKKRIG